MINKNIVDGDMIAIRLRKHNTIGFIGYDAGEMGEVYVSHTPVFWLYREPNTLETYLPLKVQKELHEKYEIDIIEVEKQIGLFSKGIKEKVTYKKMMVQQYYIDPIKKNLGVIEFIRVKHSNF